MKNLFDYATKELSQDAFIRWFFENYDDSVLGPIVVDFINHFSIGQKDSFRKPFLLEPGDITELHTYSQVNKVDIAIDFKSKKFDGVRTIAIEDKVDTQEHTNQLEHYNEAIRSHWKYEGLTPDECVYKIFYKTNKIAEDELKRVETCGWSPFGIDEIYSFFIKYKGKTQLQILNDYIEHIEKIYLAYDDVSKETADKWTQLNWETFFKKSIIKHYSNIEATCKRYRGFYSYMIVYFEIPNNKYLTYVAFEIITRSKLKPLFHPGFRVDSAEIWSINEFKEDSRYEDIRNELIELRSFVANYKSFIKRANTARSFARIDDSNLIEYKNRTAEQIAKDIYGWIDELKSIIDSFNKQKEESK